MGFSSGLPLALTFSTLSYWLAEQGVSLTAIGLFGLVRASYSLKFLWSPLIDRLPIPILTRRLGRRRSWALTIQFLLGLAILALGMTDPKADPFATALAAVVVAFLSASQDIVIDAYRIELLRPEEQGAGAAATLPHPRRELLEALTRHSDPSDLDDAPSPILRRTDTGRQTTSRPTGLADRAGVR